MNLREQWESASTLQKFLVTVVFSLISILVSYQLLIVSKSEEIEKTQEEIENIENKLALSANKKTLLSLKQKLEQMKNDNENIQSVLVEYEKYMSNGLSNYSIVKLINDFTNKTNRNMTVVGIYTEKEKEVNFSVDPQSDEVKMEIVSEDKKNEEKSNEEKHKLKFKTSQLIVPLITDYQSILKFLDYFSQTKLPITIDSVYVYRNIYIPISNPDKGIEINFEAKMDDKVNFEAKMDNKASKESKMEEKEGNGENEGLKKEIKKETKSEKNETKEEIKEEIKKEKNGNVEKSESSSSKSESSSKNENRTLKIETNIDINRKLKIKTFGSEEIANLIKVIDKNISSEQKKNDLKNNIKYCEGKGFLNGKACFVIVFNVYTPITNGGLRDGK